MSRTIEIRPQDLPLCCPLPGQTVWDRHPRVYLPLAENQGKIDCPYCGTHYCLKEKE